MQPNTFPFSTAPTAYQKTVDYPNEEWFFALKQRVFDKLSNLEHLKKAVGEEDFNPDSEYFFMVATKAVNLFRQSYVNIRRGLHNMHLDVAYAELVWSIHDYPYTEAFITNNNTVNQTLEYLTRIADEVFEATGVPNIYPRDMKEYRRNDTEPNLIPILEIQTFMSTLAYHNKTVAEYMYNCMNFHQMFRFLAIDSVENSVIDSQLYNILNERDSFIIPIPFSMKTLAAEHPMTTFTTTMSIY